MVSTPESYTVRNLCEDFLTGHIERHRDSLGTAQSRRRVMTKIAPIAGLPAASITRKQAFDLLDGERQAPRGIVQRRPGLYGKGYLLSTADSPYIAQKRFCQRP
ncbi:MAG: hypothetical protein WCA85_28995 [Paraburkholderia sp.]|uniref:hypothetical protein n=1 Tax=Paraburkholderia sp. TaxID=1926495 RepID=UPI003C4FA641